MANQVIAQLNRTFVNAYKLFGFGALLVILFGLVGYVVVNVFYLTNREWIAPVILSPSHERVVELNSQLVQQALLRDKLEVERLTLQTELDRIERTMSMNAAFKRGFEEAMEAEIASRERQLAQLDGLFKDYRKAKRELARTSKAYSGLTRERIEARFKAKLIDRDSFVHNNYLLSQVQATNLSFAETELELELRQAEVQREIDALHEIKEAMASGDSERNRKVVDYDVLLMEQEYAKAEVERASLEGTRAPIKRQIDVITEAMGKYDRILGHIQDSPYLRAIEERITLAFAPYENLDQVKAGERVYGCRLGLIWCKDIGEVVKVLDGEVAGRHPLQNRDIRGVMVEIELSDQTWAEHRSLHVGGRPLLL